MLNESEHRTVLHSAATRTAVMAMDGAMSIMFFKVRSVSRGKGHSAVAKAAYISRSRMADERTAKLHDYRRVAGLQYSEIVLPSAIKPAPESWMTDRARLWNAAESAEPRRNSRVGREYTIALPHELAPAERRELARGFAQLIADRHGVAVDIAVHGPTAKGDQRNHHAHLLASTREIDERGFGRKATMELSTDRRRHLQLPHTAQEYRELRALWADAANGRLCVAGIEQRLEPRSRRTIDREAIPTAPDATLESSLHDEPKTDPIPSAAQRAAGNWLVYRMNQLAGRNPNPTPTAERTRDLGHGLEL